MSLRAPECRRDLLPHMSLRATQWRSNPLLLMGPPSVSWGLLRRRQFHWLLLAKTMSGVFASHAVAKQSLPSHGSYNRHLEIATSPAPLAPRNDTVGCLCEQRSGEGISSTLCHCEPRSGEAIPSFSWVLPQSLGDCFVVVSSTGSSSQRQCLVSLRATQWRSNLFLLMGPTIDTWRLPRRQLRWLLAMTQSDVFASNEVAKGSPPPYVIASHEVAKQSPPSHSSYNRHLEIATSPAPLAPREDKVWCLCER